jgi:hypothetical protein
VGQVKVIPLERFGRQFVPAEFLPSGKDEHYLRNEQLGKAIPWRHLRAHEIETLVRNGNTCLNWDQFLVADPFDPGLIRNCEFSGLVRIARLEPVVLEFHDLQMPSGITDSVVISCDLGHNVAVHNVRYLAHYIVGDHAMLLNIDEMHVTNHAKFGNGIVKDGEGEDVRVWLDLVNETGARSVMPFDGMIAADAFIWARYREREELMKKLGAMTQRQFDSRRGFYGTVGDCCVIKNCQILKDVRIGPACYIKGANKLKNLTINSSEEEPSQIGEGVELVNGIVGLGCHIFYGCKAVRFVMGNNSHLKYGARLIHSYLGDNSTVSCCELLNDLIFPAHEQHHNNSFLTASLVLGQSNLAAGATIGSNHNSRANDGEIHAGRGFWPGLCVTLKHPCRFASFSLLVKGDYPSELDIPLAFSLVSDDRANDRLLVIPAYWWLYNMYALARNNWKFTTRDKRKAKTQHIEFECLAPDTAEEILRSMELLELWTGKAAHRAQGLPLDAAREDDLKAAGARLLGAPQDATARLQILGDCVESSSRPVVILKAHAAYRAYRQMLHHYAMRNLLAFMQADPSATFNAMFRALEGPPVRQWVNLGGQLAPADDVDRLLADIESGQLSSWADVHARYDRLWQEYPRRKQAHALACLRLLLGTDAITPDLWRGALDEALRIQEHVRDQVHASRKKDYDDPFRQMIFRNAAEMTAVMGTAESASFVKQVRGETEAFARAVAAIKARG